MIHESVEIVIFKQFLKKLFLKSEIYVNFITKLKRTNKMKKMRLSILACIVAMVFVTLSNVSEAQDAKPRKSPKASVTQRIGVDTDIVIDYSRPGVKGRVVWGDIVPYGLYPGNSYSKDKDYPWRAGANENTTIEFNNDLKIEGKKIPAGKYGIHMIVSEKSIKIMFNKKNADWGSYSYNSAEDALTVNVTPVKDEHMEWLEFNFDELLDDGATAYLRWERLKIPFKIELAD